jgi:hypothetical protein
MNLPDSAFAETPRIVAEYQSWNYPVFDPRFPVPQDHRFSLAVTLAGVGTFSPFMGQMAGTNTAGRRF